MEIEKIISYLHAPNEIVLFKQALFCKAYEDSAWQFCMLIKAYKPVKQYIKKEKQNSIVKERKPTEEEQTEFISSMNSYLGVMKHYKTYKLRKGMLFKKLSGWWWNYVYLSGGIAKFVLKKTNSLMRPLMACTFFLLTFGVVGRGFTQDITIKIHLRGVYESKITLLSLTGTNALKPIISVNASHGTHLLPVPVADMLPAEFILRFDYKEKETSTPYPSEKRIIISNQDLELWVNPPYCNNNDSTWFQKNEKENTVSEKFTKENGKQKEKLSLLQNFLMNYDDTQSQFYKQGIEEYEKRCGSYNQWLKEQSTLHKDLFISHTFQFCRDVACNVSFKGDALSATLSLSKCMSKGSETDRLQSVIAHYFDGIDFKDTLLLHTQQLNLFITTYVNMYASLAKTQAGLDSLYPLIGKTAIEKARLGNPKVYGWLVDYFYKGYESTNMPAGIKMLEPYINDTTCLTTKRQAIEKRLKGIKTLTIGTLAPDFIINTSSNLTGFENPLSFKTGTTFHQYKTNSRYKLLLFWSADCGHCKDLVSKLYTWYNQQHVNTPHGVYPIVDVFALSLDNTITEIPIWQNTITQLQGWKHIRCEGGINSTEANAYFILSAPVMILIDTKTNKICAIPGNTEELKHALDEISKK